MADDFTSLDLAEMLQEERRQLSWIVEDMTALYMENSKIVEKIKNLNEELEEFSIETQENSYDDSDEEDFVDFLPDVKEVWVEREDVLRGQLVEQLQHLFQDVSSLQLQQSHHGCHVPRHLWDHASQSWCPPLSAPARARWRTGKPRRTEKLLRWIHRRMPLPL